MALIVWSSQRARSARCGFGAPAPPFACDSPRPSTLIIASSGVANAAGVFRTDGVLTPFREGVVRASLLSMNDDQGVTMLTITRAVERDLAGRSGVTDSQLRQIRLLVVEDHPVVRLGLVQLLEGQHDFSVDAVCTNAEGAVAEAELLGIDVAIVDYHLGGRNGLWACRRLKQLAEPPRVIIFSAFANDHLATCCAVAGADGVLNKGGLGSELCDAVRSVNRGRCLLPRPSQPIADMLRRRLDET